VKFTERGGVRLEVRRPAATSVVDDDRFELEFRVVDTGIGMSAAQIDTLFQPFSQADASNTRRFGGTGLGLAIAKQLAELMGGHIRVTSTVGEGSVFAFTARFTPAPVEVPEDQPGDTVNVEEARSRLAGTRILVAEDNPFNQVVIKKLLTKAGATVTLCANGRLALEALEREAPFDLVLMDVQMPEMDGYAATRQIRATRTLMNTGIIAMTANAMAEDRRLCVEAGMNDFVPKPIDPDHMYLTLAKWLRPPSAND
jgi:CheY-like chemotaxis protein